MLILELKLFPVQCTLKSKCTYYITCRDICTCSFMLFIIPNTMLKAFRVYTSQAGLYFKSTGSSVFCICRITIPDSWVRYTQENIARSQKERAASERLRGEIDSTLRACANEMWNQFNGVNNAFNTRVRETTDARNKLQAHLQRVRQFFIKTKIKHRII